MAAASTVAAIAGTVIAAGSLAYSISSSQQQARLASQAKDAANQDAASAAGALAAKQAQATADQQNQVNLSNERRRMGGGVVSAGGATPAALPATPVASAPALTGGTGTLLGS